MCVYIIIALELGNLIKFLKIFFYILKGSWSVNGKQHSLLPHFRYTHLWWGYFKFLIIIVERIVSATLIRPINDF